MKQFRVLLSALALFLAAGLTFAGQKSTDTILAYEFISMGSSVQCRSIQTDCSTLGDVACVSAASHQIRENSSTESNCGSQLKRFDL